MKIIFITHGETLENKEGIIMGQLIGGKLSSLGKSQAQKLGRTLKDTKIDSAYCSDLNRAVETATEVLTYHKNLHLILTKDLRERNFGKYQGKKKSELKGLTDEWFAEDNPKFESVKDLCSRVENFLLKIEVQHKDDTVLLVGHRAWGMALGCVIKGIHVSNFNALTEMKQGQIQIFNYPSKSIKSKL